MVLFESTLTLVLLAVLLLRLTRALPIPYPTVLALAGALVAALPWAPDIAIDPQLALALFIAPALLDAGYDMPPRSLRVVWRPLLALAGMLVAVTAAAVAVLGVAMAGLPWAAAIALGAIVAPPDAAAASAMLGRFSLPRRTVMVLKGESLLNDAVALLIFTAAVSAATSSAPLSSIVPELAFAAPGGILAGLALGLAYVKLTPWVAGTLGGRLLEFASTFAIWIVAERLHLSAVLCVVAYAMTIARYLPERTPPNDRVHSYAVWETTIFLLNILAFLLMGLQARAIVTDLGAFELAHALAFAGAVLATVIVVRFVWVMAYNRLVNWFSSVRGNLEPPTLGQGVLVGWCGMRGLVTLATALALPEDFPGRDVILLSALAVVLGTLILQGLTLAPLIRLLRFGRDDSYDREIAGARTALVEAAVAGLDGRNEPQAVRLLEDYRAALAQEDGPGPRAASDQAAFQRKTIKLKRARLAELRRSGAIEDDVFHALEQELDYSELAVSPAERQDQLEG